MPEERPSQIETQIHNLPAALNPLLSRNNWVMWKWSRGRDPRTGEMKWTKIPFQPNGNAGRSNDPRTWSSYADAIEAIARFDGIGFCLDDDIAAFDVDDCRNPETGVIHPWATQLMEEAQTYAEITISGTGIRIIGYGEGERKHRQQDVGDGIKCESYRKPTGRYIVMTGCAILDKPLVNIDAVMDATIIALDALRDRERANNRTSGTQDDELAATILDGGLNRHGVSRSENLWWVIHELIRRGYDRAHVKKIITDRRNGISSHIYDQNNPSQYADKQIIKATEDLDFARDRHSKAVPTSANGYLAMWKMGLTFRHNSFSDRLLVDHHKEGVKDIQDSDVIRIRIAMERSWQLRLPKETIYDLIVEAGRLNKFHPIKDYFNSIMWDGTNRIDTWLIKYCNAQDSEYVKAVGRLFLVAAVRRIMHPGCKFDEMLVLESPQGMEKSNTLSTLSVNEEWFSDDLPLNVVGPRIIEHIRGRWIIEAAELSGLRRGDIEHLKAFLSRQTDRGRLAYARIVSDVPRECVFVGTTNSEEYLRDLTGNRRFWPVKVKMIDIDGLKKDRDQLWAEAVIMEKSNASIRLEQRLWPRAEEEQANRLTIDPYVDAIDCKLNGKSGKIAAASVWTILSIAPGNRTQDQNHRVGVAMKRLGWAKSKISADGVMVNGYTKGESPFELIMVNTDGNGDVNINYEGHDSPM
jgi:predicted P-loop ATPase